MHVPWLGLAAAGVPAFLVGFALGRFSETHKEFTMTMLIRLRAWYDRWVLVLFGLLAVAAVAGILTASSAVRQNGRDLVTQCRNANESRQAARALWGYIVDVSEAGNPDPTRRQERTIADFRAYVNDVYAPHDCGDLSKKYPLPDPPQVIEPKPRPSRANR